MAKAVLVMDMPESCSKCKFSYEFQGVKKCNGGEAIIPKDKYAEGRHACPLVELPEKNPSNPEIRQGVHYREDVYQVYANGWNACLDKILGR